jgi:hypothetical protein
LVEVRLIDAMAFLDFPGARELFVFPDAVGHGDAPLRFLLEVLGERRVGTPV